jgi:hypothetical protein
MAAAEAGNAHRQGPQLRRLTRQQPAASAVRRALRGLGGETFDTQLASAQRALMPRTERAKLPSPVRS